MAKDGWPFVTGALIAMACGLLLARAYGGAWHILTGVGAIGTLFMLFFFRDPSRQTPAETGIIVAPADGRILSVSRLADGSLQIHIFLSVFNVHVNRAPASGRVIAAQYRRGRFAAAMTPEAGTDNERQDITLEGPLGRVAFAQIAGVLARRIVCRVHEGDELRIGQRFGMIRFGSRMEVVAPPPLESMVTVGQRVRAGETIIARIVGTAA